MKRLLVLLLLGLAACPGSDTRVFTASYTVRGALRGDRAVDDRSGGRVTCTVDVDPSDPVDPTPVFTLAIVAAGDGSRQPGLYFTVHGFHGTGRYQLGESRGQMVVFDEATLADCGRPGDTSCFGATSGCELSLDGWALGDEVAPGARNGTGTGTVSCDGLRNVAADASASVAAGKFECRASDWTPTRR